MEQSKPDLVRSYAELLRRLDDAGHKLSRKTLQRYKDKPGAPAPRGNGHHSVSEWIAFIGNEGSARLQPEAMSSKEAKAAVDFERARMLKRQNDEAERLLIPAAAVTEAFTRIVAPIREAIMSSALTEEARQDLALTVEEAAKKELEQMQIVDTGGYNADTAGESASSVA